MFTLVSFGHYIGIGKLFTEPYIVQRRRQSDINLYQNDPDPYKGGVPYWSGTDAKSGTTRTGVTVPPNTSNGENYYQYLSMSGYTFFRVFPVIVSIVV